MVPPTAASPPPAAPAASRWLLVAAAAAFALLCWRIVCLAPAVQWNPARLAPSFALSRGLPIYALPNSGEQLGWFYGPVFPLWHLPATLLANPTHALVAAGIWNIVTWLAPVFLLLRAAGRRRAEAAAGTLLAGVLLAGNSVTEYGFAFIHVDALCLGFGLVACVGLHAAARGSRAGLHVAAGALAVAIWTKLPAVALAPALVHWLFLRGRRDLVRPFVLWLVVYGGALSALAFAVFGPAEVVFNVFLVHSRNPWRELPAAALAEAGTLLKSLWVWVPAAALLFLQRRARVQRPGVSPGPQDGAQGWVSLLLLAAAWQLPLGVTAALKAGGGLNSLHSLHFLVVAAVLALTDTHGRRGAGPGLAVVLWLATLLVPFGVAVARNAVRGGTWTPDRSQEQFLALAREYPGRCYFPWSPLITIVAERRISPLDDALYCLWNTGYPVPVAAVRAAVPEKPIIFYEQPAQSQFALNYFPPELRGRPER